MAKREVDIKVKYIPDTSALKSALSGAQKIDFKIGGSGLKKELLAPVQNAMKEVNKALASGADNKTLLKLFQDVGKAADLAKNKAQGMLNELNTVFSSSGNQKLLDDLKTYEKELEKSQKKLAAWDKKYSTKTGVESDYSKLRDTVTKESNGNIKTLTEARAEIKKLTEDTKELSQVELERLNNLQQFAKLGTERQNNPRKALELDVNKYQGLVNDTKLQVQTPNVNIEGTKTYTAIIRALGEAAGLSAQEINRLTTAIGREDKAAKEAVKKGQKQAKEVGKIALGSFAGISINSVFEDAIRRGIAFFKEYDETLTRTMMVTGMARDEVLQLTSSYNDLANQLSSTTKDVAAAQLVFYQQGLNTRDSLAMTEASIAISKTGGIEAGEAANRLTAAIRGYQLAASDAMDIADKMSALDAAAASSVDELTVAMQKSASQARMAGLDLDYYMAYLSTMQEVTREAPENIGTAMKSITSRMQEITDIGRVEEDGTTFSKVAKALNSIGIAATDTTGQLRPLQEIFNELGPMWATLDRNHQAYIATVLAGNRQQSRFIALMDNYDRAMELVDVSQNATGESAKQLRAYNQGLESSFIRLENAWQQLATKLADSDMIKDIVDLFSSLVEIIGKIPKEVLKLGVAFGGITVALKTINGLKTLDWVQKFKKAFSTGIDLKGLTGLEGILNKISDAAKKAFEQTVEFIDGLGNDSIKKASRAIDENSGSIERNTIVQGKNTKVKQADDSVDMQEAAEAQINSDAQETMGDAYRTATKAIKAQEKVMSSNGDAYIQEANRAMREAQARIKANEEEIRILEKKSNDIRHSKNLEVAEVRASYERKVKDPNSWKPGGELYEEAVASLKKKGALGDVEQLSLFGDDPEKLIRQEMESIAKEYGLGYNHIQEEAEKWKSENKDILSNNLSVKSLKKDIKQDKNLIKKTQKELNNYFKKEEKTSSSKNTKQGKGTDLKIAANEQLQAFIQGNENGAVSLKQIKDLFSNKNIGNISKITALLGKVNVMGGLVAGSLAQMGASIIGLADDEQEGIRNTVGLATSMAKIAPPWGAIVGASIGVVSYMLDKLTVSAEEARKSLEEINAQQDELTTKEDSITAALSKYDELKNKLTLTAEEQEELNAAANELSQLIPGAVRGYDDLGNAIISASRAQEELNSLMAEQANLARKEMKTLDDLQEAEDGWNFTRWLIEGLPWNWGNGITAGEKQAQDRANVVVEYASDINDYFTTLRDSINKEMSDTEKEIFNKISGSFRTQLFDRMLSEDPDKQLGIEEATKQYETLITNLANGLDMSTLEDALAELELTFEFGDYTFEQAADRIRDEIETMLAGAGYNAEQIDQVINVVVEMTLENGEAIIQAIENLENRRSEILAIDEEDRTDAEKDELKNINYLLEQVKNLDSESAELADHLGLLNTSAVGFIKESKGIKNIIKDFQDVNGEVNLTNGNIDQLNTLYKNLNKAEEEYRKNQEAMKKGELTWSGDSGDILDFVKKEKPEPNPINRDDLVADDLELILEHFKGKRVNSVDELEDSGIIFLERNKRDYQELMDLYNKYLSTSDQYSQQVLLKGQKDMYESAISAFENDYPEEPSYTDMITELDTAIEKTETLFDLVNKIREQNGELGAQDVSSIFGVLDGLDKYLDEGLISMDLWSTKMGVISDGFQVVDGQMKLSAEGQQALLDLQEEGIRASYREQVADLDAAEAKLLNQKAILQAYLHGLKVTLNSLETEKEAKYNETDAEKVMSLALGEYLNAQNYAQVKSTESSLNEQLEAYQQFFTQINKMKVQAENGEAITFGSIKTNQKDLYDQILDPIEKRYESLITKNESQTITNIKGEIAQVEDAISALDGQIERISTKRTLAEYLATSKNIGDFLTKGAEDGSDAQSDYNEKLERTLTLLEKIEGLQHKIDENETFKDIYEGFDGEAYGRLLMSNLDLAEQQYEVYKDLFAMQQEMTNQAAGDLLDSPYGQMFKIMENGDIGWADASMFDKYKNLPDDMQEDIDELVEAFQNQRDELRETELSLQSYAQAVKDTREEIRDLTIEAEDTIVEALKNREEILHDARIKALDDEIAMIDKAVEARQKARENENDNKELYEAQEALRRATLDSSGKNNAQLLQLQQDLEDKQLEISEKRFEQDMEDRKNWLQDTKDAETETYEYRLETMTWYWEEVAEIMNQSTEEIMNFLITWNEEYRQTSATQQEALREQWSSTFSALKTVTQTLNEPIDQLKIQLSDVTAEVEAMNIQVEKLPGNWQKATDSLNKYAAAKKAASYSGSYSSNTNNDNKTTRRKLKADNTIYAEVAGPPKSGDDIVLINTNTCMSPNEEVDVSKTYRFGGEVFYKLKNSDDFVKVEDTVAYKKGGIVDYTGPAWVDGTKTHPEAFLSAYQTEQIGALAGALDSNTVNNVSGDSNISFGSINFNVASMSSAADGRKALDIFVQGANDLMAKKGVNTKINLNIK